MKPKLTDSDYATAAAALGCDLAAIKAVAAVESRAGGFNPDDTPVTLFEGHKFYQFTKGKFAESHPTLCFKDWTKAYYGRTWMDEQARLKAAQNLAYHEACMSASWGKFQIMGFNSGAAGFLGLPDFLVAMRDSEGAQLHAFVNIVKSMKIDDELASHDWAGFAR